MNLVLFCPCCENLGVHKFKNNELVCLAEDILKEDSILDGAKKKF